MSVARPHRFGNPFVVGTPANGGNITPEVAVEQYRLALFEGRLAIDIDDMRRELHGRDLACWCALDAPCHADVLLEVANDRRARTLVARMRPSAAAAGLPKGRLIAWLQEREKSAGLVVGAVYAGLAARIERGEFDEEGDGS